jgi:hypothetical protein
MEQSLFIDYVKRSFEGVSHGIIETLNNSTLPNQLPYLHKTMLRPEFSVSGKWESLNINGTVVSADYVSMDSSLPLKIRDSYGKASGDIPKMGMEYDLNEQQLTDLLTMIALRMPDDSIGAKLFQDTKRCIQGVYERNEATFLQGLSTGITLVQDDKNVGTGIRIDYKYPAANKFGVSVLWSNTTATPLKDIATRILEKASSDGKVVSKILIDKATLQNILKTDEAKDMYALSIGNYGAQRPIPNLEKINTYTQAEYGYVFQIVDRTVTAERDGIRTAYKPFAANAVVALTTDVVGTLTYSFLAEMSKPVAGVEYQTLDSFILVSKFSTNRPALAEFTTSQARVVPVVGETVYLMDSATVQA